MVANEVEQALADAAAEVLETMFFTSVAEEEQPAPTLTAPCVCARLVFRGLRAGLLGVRVPVETAGEIAANFLGLERRELTDVRVGDVICELTNMVCGVMLGRLENNSLFELGRPELEARDSASPRSEPAACRTLALEGGAMEVWLEWERPQ